MMMMMMVVVVPVSLPVVGAWNGFVGGKSVDIDIGERDLGTSRTSEQTRLAYICTPSSLTSCFGCVC